MQPVSFIIPAYNCHATVAESIASIVDGNLSEGDEIVIVDDGSTDNTPRILAELASANKSLRVVTHRHNRGGGAARNAAVQNARHDLIFCLDSDNLLIPGSVVALRMLLSAEKADVVTFRELHYFKHRADQPTHRWCYSPGDFTLADHLAGHIVPGASGNYLYTRASWVRAGGYPEVMLDTWGFAFRQLATGHRMVVMEDGFYCHRYGHESYWVRESKDRGRVSLMALQVMLPFLDLLDPSDVDYIMSSSGRLTFFFDLDRRPLRLASGNPGKTGVSLKGAPKGGSAIRRTPRNMFRFIAEKLTR